MLITVHVLADSIYKGVRLTTLELTYPRILLPELNTHRVFSRSTQSNRAVSAKRLRRLVREYNYYPVFTGEQRGMQGSPGAPAGANLLWWAARESALFFHWVGSLLGIHKQSVNRLLEPFQSCKTVLSSTEWENFLHLRLNADKVQPEMYLLACGIQRELANSLPKELEEGQWHLPYGTGNSSPAECAARCARVSYLSPPGEDRSLAARLVMDEHWSPFEHVAQAGGEHHRNFAPGWGQLRGMLER